MGSTSRHTRRGFIGGSIAAVGAGAIPRVATAADDRSGLDGDGSVAPRFTEAIPSPTIVPGSTVRTLGPGDCTAMTTSTGGSPPSQLVLVPSGKVYNGGSGNTWVHFPIEVPPGASLAAAHVLGELQNGASLGMQTFTVDMLGQTTDLEIFSQTGDGPFAIDVAPTSGYTGAVGKQLSVLVLARTVDQGVYGLVYQYLPALEPAPAPQEIDVFTPVSPFRAFDSRVGAYPAAGQLGPNDSKTVSIKDAHDAAGAVDAADVVPDGATAVAYNLTIVGATGPNFVAITPGDATGFTTSAINFQDAGAIANAGTVALDGSRQVTLWGGDQTGAMHTLIDITGYWAPETID